MIQPDSFLFLGTGASTGVPVVGCDCVVCTSSDPHNQRLRPAGLLKIGGKSLLIDIGPDFRQQALRYGIQRLDGVLLTHTHFDHIAGLDELRVMNFHQKKPVPCLVSEESYAVIQKRYDYLFREPKAGSGNRAEIDFQVLPKAHGQIQFCDVPFEYMSYRQGEMQVNGYRFGSFAYLTDIRTYEEAIFFHLQGVKTLVLSSLREEASKVHFSFEEATFFARQVEAKQTWLTHLSHAVDYVAGSHKLPPDVRLGYDGLTLLLKETR
jgi:phosphoribosyl 1,2-cyclic phosphate phosphodiesterase